MNRLSLWQLLKSKTFWTAAAGVAFNIWNQESPHLGSGVVELVNGAIGLGVAIFRMFPGQSTPLQTAVKAGGLGGDPTPQPAPVVGPHD